MALIRCPDCDTLHDLEGSFFASGPRKVRCASCRTVWEASDSESSMGVNVVIPKLDPNRERPAPRVKAGETTAETTDLKTGKIETPLDQSAIDAIDFSTPEMPADEGADISAAELEALFAEEASPAPVPVAAQILATSLATSAAPLDEPIEFDPASLARMQDAARDGGAADSVEERRRLRRNKRLAVTEAHHRTDGKRKGAGPVAVMLMAAGFGTLAMVGLLRNETVRLFPGSAPVFEAIGLAVNLHGLDINEVKSRLVLEESRETLEVTGTIVNLTQAKQKLPVLRLSIRSAAGQEIYVWTATADQPELGPGEKTMFRRRLASPPPESHSVLVRFVAKDDIVAAIR